MKFRPVWTIIAVVVLISASVTAVRYIDRIPARRLAQLFGITVTVSDLSVTPSVSPRVTPVGGDRTVTLGSVAVQTFAGPRLVRTGAGTAVSADGLILTTIATAPYGGGNYIYQIATSRGQLVRAFRVAVDQNSGLALLKAETTDLDAVLFDAGTTLVAGQGLEAVSATVHVSKYADQRLPVWVVWVSENGQTTISLDRSIGPAFNGARLVDQSNRSVGLMRYTTAPLFISAPVINSFLESYLSKSVNQD